MNEPAHTRVYFRQVLAIAQRARESTPVPERTLFESVRRLSREPLSVAEFRGALQWNEQHGYAERSFDDVADTYAWALTAAGLKKEGAR